MSCDVKINGGIKDTEDGLSSDYLAVTISGGQVMIAIMGKTI